MPNKNFLYYYFNFIFLLQTNEIVFHYAAKEGNVEVVKEIVGGLNSGQIQIAVNKQSSTGWTPLMIASQNGHLDIVKVTLLAFVN